MQTAGRKNDKCLFTAYDNYASLNILSYKLKEYKENEIKLIKVSDRKDWKGNCCRIIGNMAERQNLIAFGRKTEKSFREENT